MNFARLQVVAVGNNRISMDGRLPVVEIFKSYQGEGALIGKQSVFLRFFGCGERCTWCDSMHAVDPKYKDQAVKMTTAELLTKIQDIPLSGGEWFTLTGGDPCIHDLSDLCIALKSRHFKINVETQGKIYKGWLAIADKITCSPKGPTSGMQVDWKVLYRYVQDFPGRVDFKIVIFDPLDLDFAEKIHEAFPEVPLYLTVGSPVYKAAITGQEAAREILPRYEWLVTEVMERPTLRNATILPQMHVMIWGNAKAR
jgi:7-carboxy-7-deazaguanine synthase